MASEPRITVFAEEFSPARAWVYAVLLAMFALLAGWLLSLAARNAGAL